VSLFLPLFNDLTGKHLLLANAFDARLLAWLIVLLATIILLTGLYPALILSDFKPAEILYNRQKFLGKNFFGKMLIVVQFSLVVFLLIASIVYNSQMQYVHTKDLGYDPSQIIKIDISGDRDYRTLPHYLKNELAKEPAIRYVSFDNDGYTNDIEVEGKVFKASHRTIDENFLATLDITLIKGGNFDSANVADKNNGVLVNEAFLRAVGTEDAIGKRVNLNPGLDSTVKIIIGVVKDFHFGSLREPILPMVMYTGNDHDGSLFVKLDRRAKQRGISTVERVFKSAMPNTAFQYQFLDQLNARQYLQDRRWQKIMNIATLLSFLVCCLGLFGLAHLSAGRRVKEIGVRKVLGASVSQIVSVLSLDFLKLITIAFVVAAPAAWMVMNSWLQEFAYRINISWWMFALAGALVVIIALITVSLQAIKAAVANPVRSLRTE
jgi:putative ABC transport system permease protein